MMRKSVCGSAAKYYVYCYVCVLMTLLNQVRCETVNKEVLKEEHLLPVRVARGASENRFDGSGDGDIPITALRSQVMERMTLARDNEEMGNGSLVGGEAKEEIEAGDSKETVEDWNEGSGLSDRKSGIINATEASAKSEDAESEWENYNGESAKSRETEIATTAEGSSGDVEILPEISTWSEKATTASPATDPVEDAKSELTTIDADATETATQATTASEANSDATTVVEEDASVANVHSEVTTTTTTTDDDSEAEGQVSTAKYAEATDFAKPEEKSETTTVGPQETTPVVLAAEKSLDAKVEGESRAVTEIVEAKHVKPAFAVETLPEGKTETEAPETTATQPVAAIETTTQATAATENENLTSETDPLHMKVNSRLLDSNDTVLLSSKEASRLGTYIVISLILLSFLSLIGFILMKKRMQRGRKQANLDQENLDTEKALLSLSEYKDHPDGIDEGKIKNNEITPIVIKSNSQINKFEKNTNFSSPKNLNTKANEKNVEKDNVLKKATDNLTQVIIEDPAKDVEEEKTPTNAEKLIVRTHLDQDSIPRKPVIVNRTSLGCVPVSQD